jgi:hypothetical protein
MSSEFWRSLRRLREDEYVVERLRRPTPDRIEVAA